MVSKFFGALLVGFYEGKKLKFAGRVGTGFTDKLLRSLFSELEKILVDTCPISNLPAVGRSRWDQGLTVAEMKRCRCYSVVLEVTMLIFQSSPSRMSIEE
jgi:ATP-dependent DNA ligase